MIVVEIYEPMKTLDRNLIRNKALLFEKIAIRIQFLSNAPPSRN